MKKITFIFATTCAVVFTFLGNASAAEEKTIIGVASESPQFKTLISALKAADLLDTLSGAGPFTLFAPTDEAFAKIPKDTLDDLMRPENKGKLAAILTYHVIPGRVIAADMKTSSVKTVNGNELPIVIDVNKIIVGAALATKNDLAASNGIIHIIDTVLMPPMKK